MLKKLLNKYNGLPVQVRASLWFMICSFLQKGISFITTPIFTRLLNSAEYGAYGVYTSWDTILTVFITLQLSLGVYVQGLVKFEKDKNVFSSSLLGLTTTLSAFWFVVFGVFNSFFCGLFELNTLQLLSIPVDVWLVAVCTFWSTDQRVDYKYRKLVLVTVVSSILRPLAGIAAVIIFDDKVTARIISTIVVYAALYIVLFAIMMKKGKVFFHKKYWKYAIKFNLPLIPHYLSTSILNGADRIMIARMVGEREAGFYTLAYSISLIMSTLSTALLKTIEPWLFKNIRDKQLGKFSKVSEPSFIFVAVVNLFLIVLAPEIIRAFAPVEYLDAIWVIPPVSMSVFFTYMYTFYSVFEFYYEKTIYISVATVLGAVFNIATNYIFIGLFGYLAAGYTTLFCYIMFALMHYVFMTRILKKNLNGVKVYRLRNILIISISFMACGFALMATYPFMIVRYLIVLLLIAAAIVMRKRIIAYFKSLGSLKKEKSKETA